MSADDLSIRNAARAMARKYVAWVTKERENPLPKAVQPAAQKAAEVVSWRPEPRNAEQDRQIEENKRALEIAQKYAKPKDGGEIDEPRQPIQMQREFSNDQEKEAYLERIRAAQRNAAK